LPAIEAQLPHLGDQRRPAQAQAAGGAIRTTHHPARLPERLQDVQTFRLFQRDRRDVFGAQVRSDSEPVSTPGHSLAKHDAHTL
jgi:hypothetical protein